jgi:AcrR family transcriptional regulator
MDDIAAEAGITKPILYRHFGDKGGLCRALAERQFNAIQTLAAGLVRGEADPTGILAVAIDGFLAFKEANAVVFHFLERQAASDEPELQGAHEYFAERCTISFAELLRPRLVGRGVDPRAVEPWTRAMIGAVTMVTDWWLHSRSMPREELVQHLVSLFRGGMLLEGAMS